MNNLLLKKKRIFYEIFKNQKIIFLMNVILLIIY